MTAHTDETFARTWSMLQKKKGNHALGLAEGSKKKTVGSVKVGRPLRLIKLHALTYSRKAVCVSACGNFGLGCSSTGAIVMWNMQSGMQRKTFDVGPCPPDAASRFRPQSGKKKAEERCVTGLATDALNRVVIASTLDGTLNVLCHRLLSLTMY